MERLVDKQRLVCDEANCRAFHCILGIRGGAENFPGPITSKLVVLYGFNSFSWDYPFLDECDKKFL